MPDTRRRISVPLDDDSLAKLQEIADREDRSINVQASRMLRQILLTQVSVDYDDLPTDNYDVES